MRGEIAWLVISRVPARAPRVARARATRSSGHPDRMLARVLLATLAACASAAVELTPDNFDEVVFGSGKAAFIKFLAPW